MVGVRRMKSDIPTEEGLLFPAVPIYSKTVSGWWPGSGLGFQSEADSKQGTDWPQILF